MRNKIKDEVLRRAAEMPELPRSYYDMLERDGFKTGSSVYSGAEPADEDWVIMAPPRVFEEFACGYDKDDADKKYWDDDFVALYALYRGRSVNIICMNNYKLYDNWKATTDMMSYLHRNSILGHHFDSKWKRVRIFRAIRDILYDDDPLAQPMDMYKAIAKWKCRICGRSVQEFTCAAAKQQYKETGICEGCEEKIVYESL